MGEDARDVLISAEERATLDETLRREHQSPAAGVCGIIFRDSVMVVKQCMASEARCLLAFISALQRIRAVILSLFLSPNILVLCI